MNTNTAHQIYKNVILIQQYRSEKANKFISVQLLDEIVDRLMENSIHLINPDPSDELIDNFMDMVFNNEPFNTKIISERFKRFM
jgi:hypothetical protein